MAYHEHVYNGHLVRRHYNGHRFISEQREIAGPPPIEQHNDPIYEQEARRLMAQLEVQIGKLQYYAWMLRTFKPNTTWRDVLVSAEMTLKHPEVLDCRCCHEGESCDICESVDHALSLDEFPENINKGAEKG